MKKTEQIAAVVKDLEKINLRIRDLPLERLATIIVDAVERAQPPSIDPYSITDFYRENAK